MYLILNMMIGVDDNVYDDEDDVDDEVDDEDFEEGQKKRSGV